jgi:hypothetical protein
MGYNPTYTTDANTGKTLGAAVKTDPVALPIGGKLIPGYQTTYKDGTSKWISSGDAQLNSGYDYSTFTSTKDKDGKWQWTPTTSNSVQNLSAQNGVTNTQVNQSLYKTPALQTQLNGNRVNQLGGIAKAKKIDPTLPSTGGNVDNPNTPVDQTSAVSAEQKAASESEQQSAKDNARTSYSDLKYPKTLQLEYQDCIKFSALQYEPPGLSAQTGQGAAAGFRAVSLKKDQKPGIGNRKILGTVTLPIPAGIGDGNSVGWQDDSLDPLSKAFADVATKTITGGGSAGVSAAESQVKGATAGGGSDAKSMVVATFAQLATNTNNLQQRLTGAIGNPNLELLFTGPSLRSFTFTFRLSPRSKEEAIEVRRIIRFFKQTMSVKRSTSTLLLRSPHTFAIAYLTSNKEHPYLNKFKECALQSCNVSYAPDGNYMSFNGPEPSMTSYELSLTFKELEAIFDDDYPKDNDTSIGY